MIELSIINKEKSIELERLVLKLDWLDYLDKIVFTIVAIAFILIGAVIELEIRYDGMFTGFLIFFLAPLFIILGAYCVYRKLEENKLIFINTNFSKIENQKRLEAFLRKYKYNIYKEKNDITIVIDEHMMSFNGLWRKQYVFIVSDFGIRFNIHKLYPIISPPVLFDHFLLRHDLRKFIAET